MCQFNFLLALLFEHLNKFDVIASSKMMVVITLTVADGALTLEVSKVSFLKQRDAVQLIACALLIAR